MNIQKIAQFLLERRHRASPIVLHGEVIEAIESEGLEQALARRWLVPDMDTGNLQVASSPAHIAEMEEIAESTYSPPAITASGAANLAYGHAQRHLIHEIAAPATGKPAPSMTPSTASPPPAGPAPTPTAPPAPAPAAPAAPAGDANDGKELQIGDNVVVEEGRRAYQGRISARTPDGNYRVSFGPERPPRTRDYAPGEVRRTVSDRS